MNIQIREQCEMHKDEVLKLAIFALEYHIKKTKQIKVTSDALLRLKKELAFMYVKEYWG